MLVKKKKLFFKTSFNLSVSKHRLINNIDSSTKDFRITGVSGANPDLCPVAVKCIQSHLSSADGQSASNGLRRG